MEYLKNNRRDGINLWEQLRRPNSPLAPVLAEMPEIKDADFSREVIEAAVIDAKYEGYLDKQARLAAGLQAWDKKQIPTDLDYGKITHLRPEAKEKLTLFRPQTLGQVGRISGITPADVTVIQIHLKKYYQDIR
jgi:tRNA uridine 5-carboxymethylaminomethyl modification enzyme